MLALALPVDLGFRKSILLTILKRDGHLLVNRNTNRSGGGRLNIIATNYINEPFTNSGGPSVDYNTVI